MVEKKDVYEQTVEDNTDRYHVNATVFLKKLRGSCNTEEIECLDTSVLPKLIMFTRALCQEISKASR
jgi:hypothetical protein